VNGQLEVLSLQETPPVLSSEQIELARKIRHVLLEGDDVSRREILRGLVDKVVVERYGRNLAGHVWFYVPTLKNKGDLKAKSTENTVLSEYTARRSRRGST